MLLVYLSPLTNAGASKIKRGSNVLRLVSVSRLQVSEVLYQASLLLELFTQVTNLTTLAIL
jgi:hypothetical protein